MDYHRGMTYLHVLDILLGAGLTLRLTRLVVTDDLGQWWIKDPLDSWLHRGTRRIRLHKYLSGLECVFCVGFWVGAGALASLALAGGPGEAHEVWRWVAAAFALNWVTAHVGSRAGDAGYAED